MRESKVIIPVMTIAMFILVSCTKTSYKSYNCYCVQEDKGDILDTKEYGVQATDLGEAGVNCNDIENRVNEYAESIGDKRAYNCKIK